MTKDEYLEQVRVAGPCKDEDREVLQQILTSQSLQRMFYEVLMLMDNQGLGLLTADLISETGRADAIKRQGVAVGMMTAVEYILDYTLTVKELS